MKTYRAAVLLAVGLALWVLSLPVQAQMIAPHSSLGNPRLVAATPEQVLRLQELVKTAPPSLLSQFPHLDKIASLQPENKEDQEVAAVLVSQRPADAAAVARVQ